MKDTESIMRSGMNISCNYLEFLIDKQIDVHHVKHVLDMNKKNINSVHDRRILNQILEDLSAGTTSLLDVQEINFLKRNGENIWTPYLIYRYKFKEYPKRKTVSDFPVYLLIEPTSICNLRCVMCFQVDKTFSSNRKYMGTMDINFFKRLIDEAHKGGTLAITMASRGEPTLHPKLGEMLHYCTGKFFELKINTNAMFLDEKRIHEILGSGVTEIVFSIDSYTKEDYESTRIKGDFKRVVRNIQKFHEIREKQYAGSACISRISGVKVWKKHDSRLFKKFWKDLSDELVIVGCEQRWDTYRNPVLEDYTSACSLLWERMYIWHDGTCNPCDVDYKSYLSPGSVCSNSISEIWLGEKYRQLRSAHMNKKRSAYMPCDRCSL